MEVLDRQQVLHARLHPVLCRAALALRAMPVAARIVGDPFMIAVLASLHVTAQCRRSTGLDRRHDLELLEAYMAPVGVAPAGAVTMEDVGDLE